MKGSTEATEQYFRPTLFKDNKKDAKPENLFWAVEYDLSFLRMNNKDWDNNTNRNHSRQEPVVIIYNSNILSNPPAIFSFKE